MFQSLLKLYKNNPNKTPFEDFNTEIFAGILSLFPEVLEEFTKTFLEIPEDKYQIKTQFPKKLKEDTNCIVDFVLEGKENICFIENKVESTEGDRQLERYGKALNLYPNLKKHLVYCTKYSEPKDDKFGDEINFKQFKWYEIAKFLKQYNENQLIKNYIEFLKINKMEQDNTFKIENLLALENLNKSIEIAEFHIDNEKVKKEFEDKFPLLSHSDFKKINWGGNYIKEYKRIDHKATGILKSKSGKYSEVLYSIQLETLELRVHFFVNKEHEEFKGFNEIDVDGTNLSKVESDTGTSIFKAIPLGGFLNDEGSDISIKNWFIKSFDELIKLIESNKQLNWKQLE